MTPKGHALLTAELENLKKVERSKNIADIAEARAHGDLKENAEYHAAKERQGFIEGRIREIGGTLADAQVVDTSKLSTEKVVFGVTVKLLDVDTDEEKQYTIVGRDEADLKNGTISIHSPVARALIGRTVGDYAEVIAPAKTVEYEILSISFES